MGQLAQPFQMDLEIQQQIISHFTSVLFTTYVVQWITFWGTMNWIKCFLSYCRRLMDLLINLQKENSFWVFLSYLSFQYNLTMSDYRHLYTNDKMSTWHTIPWLHSWNKLKFKFKFSVYLQHFKQQKLELRGPRPLLFMN